MTPFVENDRKTKSRTVRIFSKDRLPEAPEGKTLVIVTQTKDRYAVHTSGAFINLDKDRRSPKERKRERRKQRLEAGRQNASITN